MLAAGSAFASKHQTRPVSPVSPPALAAGRQPGLHPTAAAPARSPPGFGVPSLAKTRPPPHLAWPVAKVPGPAPPCKGHFVFLPWGNL